MVKVILSGGGTGGHIYPALTIADQIKKIRPEAEIIFVGTQQGLEKDIIPRYGYPLKFIEVAGFKRSLSLDTLRSFYKMFKGLWDAWGIIREEHPDLVIGTGGYVCGPIVWVAAKYGIPTCIQEQNAMPGVTNKILAGSVKKVFLGYKEAEKYFAGKSAKMEYTGNPIRAEILACDKDRAYEELGLSPKKKTILVSGGSRGARSINAAMQDVELALSGREEIQILHATGDVNYEKYMEELRKKGTVGENIVIKPYLHNMPQALAVADLAVFRAGAIGLAELMAKGVPSILVPYPFATANHQEYNANAVQSKGAAKVILDKELTGDRILEIVENLLLHENELKEMSVAAKKLGRPEAAENIAKQALELMSK